MFLLYNDTLKYLKKLDLILHTCVFWELQQIALNDWSDTDLHWHIEDFMKIYKKYTSEPYSFLIDDTTSPSDNPLRLSQNLLK